MRRPLTAEVWKALWYREGASRYQARNCCLPLADIHLLSPAQGLSSQESVGPMGGGFAAVTQTCDELGRGLDQVKASEAAFFPGMLGEGGNLLSIYS